MASGAESGPAPDSKSRNSTSADSMVDLLAAAEPTAPRRLGELIQRLEASGRLRRVRPVEHVGQAQPGPAPGSLVITGVGFDSRSVRPLSVFVAIPGAHVDGHDFVVAAAALGAAAAIVERPVPAAAIPQVVVDDARRALATAAAWWYGDPSRELSVVGVTGTDGKTTTAFLSMAVLEEAGLSTGLISTAAVKVGSLRTENPEHVTTPESPQLQQTLRAMVAAGNTAAIVETTSHGLALARVAEVVYDIAIFTNLSHEHLDLHGTFEAYREAKLSLFRGLGDGGGIGGVAGERSAAASVAKLLPRPWPRTAIVNADDPAAPLFIAAAQRAGAAIITYGESAGADVRAVTVEEDAHSLRVEVATPRWDGLVELQIAGRFNALNATAAVALGEALNLDPEAIRRGLTHAGSVPGRMERVACGQPFGVIVDYAHSPAALQSVLDLLAPVAAARGGGLIAVFGSAGERDVQKRPMMGRIAAERCRLVIVTDEDPRGEDSSAILDQIAAGAQVAGKGRGVDVLCIADRRQAIAAAFGHARPGDVVLLAGKGHERSIIMSDGPRPWDERAEAVRALVRLGFGSK
jgi:UDP-N-acetylmuramoyl-L-alanyl-D-glutamate--2,6-diaminopimelate ligase